MRLTREFSPKQLEWRNELETRQGLRQSGLCSQAEHENWLKYIENNPSCIYFGLEVEGKKVAGFKKKPEIVGYCGLSNMTVHHQKNHGTGEYSILIGKEFRGKGYAKEAMKLLLDYAFKCVNLELVWGEILANNPAGLELALKIGFTQEGVLRGRYVKQGERVDSISVSMYRREWTALHG